MRGYASASITPGAPHHPAGGRALDEQRDQHDAEHGAREQVPIRQVERQRQGQGDRDRAPQPRPEHHVEVPERQQRCPGEPRSPPTSPYTTSTRAAVIAT